MQIQPVENELKSDLIVLNDQYYDSEEYLQSIPKNNPKWVYSSLTIDDDKMDQNQFEPPLSDDASHHKYHNDIQQAFNLFNEWNQWPQTQDGQINNGWKLVSKIKKNQTYLNIFTNNNTRVTKSEITLPYSSPIICGIFCNNEHYSAIDESILSSKILKQHDNNSYSVYVECNKPFPFSSHRDLLMIRFCYVFNNGHFIFGEKSINDADNDENVTKSDEHNPIRADMINLWSVKPSTKDSSHCVITHYCSYNPNGGFSKYLLQKIKMDKAKYLLKLYEYVDEIHKLLHIEGQLFIPNKLYNLMDINGSLQRFNKGENNKEIDISSRRRGSNDDNIIDINLAVQSAIVDVKHFFNNMRSQ